MAVLDTSGLWSSGDDYRVIKAISLPFGTYTQDCIITCMNDLQAMSTVAQQDVLDLLTDYSSADTAQITQNLANVEGKTLVDADVLKWEVNHNGTSGPQSEKLRVKSELIKIFSFCSCLGSFTQGSYQSTQLIRS